MFRVANKLASRAKLAPALLKKRLAHITVSENPSKTLKSVHLPLPSATVAFSVNENLTLGSLIENIKTEDSSVRSVVFKGPSGDALAKATRVWEMLQDQFTVEINDKKYFAQDPDDTVDVELPDTRALLEVNKVLMIRGAIEADPRYQITYKEFGQICKNISGLTDNEIATLSSVFHRAGVFLHYKRDPTLKDIVIIKPSHVAHRVCSMIDLQHPVLTENVTLLGRIKEIGQALIPLQKRKDELDEHARKNLQRWIWGAGAYLTVQMGVLMRWTWIDYGWDVVEPMAYFIGFVVVLGGYFFWAKTGVEYSFPEAHNRLYAKRQLSTYMKYNFNIRHFDALEDEMNDLSKKIQDNCMLLYGEVPDHVQNEINAARHGEDFVAKKN